MPARASERIALDGKMQLHQKSLSAGLVELKPQPPPHRIDQDQHSSQAHSHKHHHPRTNIVDAAPTAPPLSLAALQALVDEITSAKNVVVITGAGVSTESSIPDYRSPKGAYNTGFTPMTHQQFLANPANRARYWARSYAGWHAFSSTRPSGAHEGLSRLQERQWVGPIITQNVDRLHNRAGARNVLELHGTTHRVVCLGCGAMQERGDVQRKLDELNPDMSAHVEALKALASGMASKQGVPHLVPMRRPDGDVELVDAGHAFKVPPCDSCGGILKPDVVFFGDSVPAARAQSAMEMCTSSDLILAAGTSLQVFSAYRLVDAAKRAGARLVLLNVGPTRADKLADLKVEAIVGEALMAMATHPQLLLPRL